MTTQTLETLKRLGQLLVRHGDISGEQLIRAIQSQRSVGGRIGTCLLEMEVLTEDRLLATLSEQLGVPAVRIEQLRGIDEDVLRRVPPKVALRCQAVPFAVSPAEISIATLNVRDLALLDELAFCTAKRVVPHIANEVRIFEALEKYYGFECPRRYGHLLDRLNRSRYLWDESAKMLIRDEAPDLAAPPLPAPEWDEGFDENQLIRSAASHSSVGLQRPRPPGGDDAGDRPADQAPPLATPTAPAESIVHPSAAGAPAAGAPAVASDSELWSLTEVHRQLSQAQDRERIGAVLLRFLAQGFQRSALYQVRRTEVRGWLARGEGLDRSHFRSLRLALDQPSIFFNLDSGAEFYRGPLPPMPAHLELVRPWGGGMPRECLAVPMRIRQRLVCVLYGDRGASELDGLDVEIYLTLARKGAAAFERCILRHKTQVA